MFPYQSHINRLRDALWKRPGSVISVMVGSGFSRNAEKVRFDAEDIPLWQDIAFAIHRSLDPERANEHQRNTNVPTYTAESALRLGEEYRTAFGRSKLHEFLQQLVRDSDFSPGEAHDRLLRLPWRDVFSTNWDTLLERASSEISTPAYSVVQNMDQLPSMGQPRIVKLHGSLPAHFPLIFTEEDYRTYPIKYAPYVNTVQQAMMESLFLLIGFSGDDPNFLNWSGWVRDNLGEAAPQIYLAGWLDVSPHTRRMLEDRGVIAIDIADHSKAGEWPERMRHQYATEWLLLSLEKGRPYDSSDWPSALKHVGAPVLDHLRPVHEVVDDMPRSDPATSASDTCEPIERIKEVLDVWTHNRKLYPGWLFLPFDSGSRQFSRQTHQWEQHILNGLDDLTPVEQLHAIREMVWRLEILLEPITVEIEAAAERALDAIDCVKCSIDGNYDTRGDWPEIREAWRAVAIALVMDARYECRRDLFDRRLESLKPLLSEDPDTEHRVKQEVCLWVASSLDFDKLDELLDGWDVRNCDPAWILRKAALLTEAGRYQESEALIQTALQFLRKTPTTSRTIASVSREGWALASTLSSKNRDEVFRVWDRLAPLKCNVSLEIDQFSRALEGIEKKEAPLFDFSVRRGKSISISSADHARLIAAYRAIRLPEVVGMSFRINPIHDVFRTQSMAFDIIGSSADVIARAVPELAVRLVLRSCINSEDVILQRLVSRPRVAALADESLVELANSCIGVVEQSLPKLSASEGNIENNSWSERMRVALEVLSRLSSRLPQEMVKTALNISLECYQTPEVAQHIWFRSPVRSLLVRSWQSLSKKGRSVRAFDLLSAPIVGFEGFLAHSHLPDPGALVSSQDLPQDRALVEVPKLRSTVGFLVRGLHSNGASRKRAIVRLMPLVSSGLLTRDESLETANALWEESDPILDNSTVTEYVEDWMYLLLPELEEGKAVRSFREKWLAPTVVSDDEKTAYAINVLSQVGAAVSELERDGKGFFLSKVEQGQIAAQFEHLTEVFSSSTVSIGSTLWYSDEAIRALAARVTTPIPIAEKLFQRIESWLHAQVDPRDQLSDFVMEMKVGIAFAVVPILVRALPDRFETVTKWIRTGLGSEDDSRARGAMAALKTWLSASAKSEMVPVPDDLIREVGAIIAAGRRVALADALICARVVLEEGLPIQRDAIGPLALAGLSHLAEKLQYELDQDSDADVHTLRLFCTQLAACMAKSGFENDAAVVKWLEIGKNDPFSEIRNTLVDPKAAH